MKKNNSVTPLLFTAIFAVSFFISCSKSDSAGPTPPAPGPCDGKTIEITATPTAASGCSNNGSIATSATGSTGFSYKLNSGGSYQASGDFANLAAGTYTVFAKDAAGCEKSSSVTVSSNATEGPLFTAVKNLVATRCQSCHNSTVQNGGMNWTIPCNIVANKGRINQRAVVEGTMPPTGTLPQAEKDIITAWINAGGELSD
ncbi:MAG: hypothetical protein QM791_08660 [Ferruginibacter sp.]